MAVGIVVLGGWFSYGFMYSPPQDTPQLTSSDGDLPALPGLADWSGDTPWIAHRPGLHKQLAAQGHTVFVNYTAIWCTECLVQKITVLNTEAVRSKMRELGVVPIKADFTRRPDWMAEELKVYGHAGVPLDVILPAGKPDEPIVMPDLLTKGAVLRGLEQAGPSNPRADTELVSIGVAP
jgi:thiol:disulfide interchange protein DsbD